MEKINLGGNPFEYDDGGKGKTLLLMSGWCQDHRLFKHIVEPLREQYRVIRLNWRGHDATRTYDGDFTVGDQINDVVAFLDAKDVQEVVPLSTSHGGWANIGISERLGVDRAPKTIVIDWLMMNAFTDLMNDLRASQNPATWKQGRDNLFNEWVLGTDNQDMIRHVWDEMGSFDEEMWTRSCREIERAYEQWNSPLQRMAAVKPTRPITHIYSQPLSEEYDQMQREFSLENPWFSSVRIQGKTHFPTLESPQAVVQAIRHFMG